MEAGKKEFRFDFKLTEGQVKMLAYCSKVYSISKGEVVRAGLELLYAKAKGETS